MDNNNKTFTVSEHFVADAKWSIFTLASGFVLLALAHALRGNFAWFAITGFMAAMEFYKLYNFKKELKNGGSQ